MDGENCSLKESEISSLLQLLASDEAKFHKRRRITEQLLTLSGESLENLEIIPSELSASQKNPSAALTLTPAAGTAVTARTVPRNDYAQHYVNKGERPGSFVMGTDPSARFEEQPKLKQLLVLKRALLDRRALPALSLRCDLRTFDLTSLGSRFDAILIDPPWEEYYRRCPALADASERNFWNPEDIMNLRIGEIAAAQSFVWLWVGSSEGLDLGRAMLRKWGYRRCEDICWVKTRPLSDLTSAGSQLLHDHDRAAPLVHIKEHCLMGIRGTVRRALDGHLIHANIDTDVIVAPEPPLPSTQKPTELYELIERFSNGLRRLELFGTDRNVRPGWLTLGNSLGVSNFQAAAYARLFADGHLAGTTEEIESLRPRSPTRGGPPSTNKPS